jgi:hypothetical protein
LIRTEVLLQVAPALPVVALQLRRIERRRGRTQHETRLEHECQRLAEELRLQAGGRSAIIGRGIRSMRRHAVVQAAAAGREALCLRVIDAKDGGRNVCSATIQRGGKMTKSQFAVPAISDGEVSTVKIDGSG